MDFWDAIKELHEERDRLTAVIRNLEALVEGKQPGPLRRRGRKNMSAPERAEVSARMKKYWAARRGAKQAKA